MIKLQKQCISKGCVSACLAMLTNQPVEQVTEEFHKAYVERLTDIADYLQNHNVEIIRTANRELIEFEKVYLLMVPSLNTLGLFHEVILDTRNHQIQLYDPAREGSQQYTVDKDAGPGFTRLTSWIIDYEITVAPAIGLEGVGDGSCS